MRTSHLTGEKYTTFGFMNVKDDSAAAREESSSAAA
jgi:hypothetical protein